MEHTTAHHAMWWLWSHHPELCAAPGTTACHKLVRVHQVGCCPCLFLARPLKHLKLSSRHLLSGLPKVFAGNEAAAAAAAVLGNSSAGAGRRRARAVSAGRRRNRMSAEELGGHMAAAEVRLTLCHVLTPAQCATWLIISLDDTMSSSRRLEQQQQQDTYAKHLNRLQRVAH